MRPDTNRPESSFRARTWPLAGLIGLPLVAMTIYLLWLWPRPDGTSFVAQTSPYFLSLLPGLPFALILAPKGQRLVSSLIYLVVGFVALWIYALAFLCGVRGSCL